MTAPVLQLLLPPLLLLAPLPSFAKKDPSQGTENCVDISTFGTLQFNTTVLDICTYRYVQQYYCTEYMYVQVCTPILLYWIYVRTGMYTNTTVLDICTYRYVQCIPTSWKLFPSSRPDLQKAWLAELTLEYEPKAKKNIKFMKAPILKDVNITFFKLQCFFYTKCPNFLTIF